MSYSVDFEKKISYHKKPKPFKYRTVFANDCIIITVFVPFYLLFC